MKDATNVEMPQLLEPAEVDSSAGQTQMRATLENEPYELVTDFVEASPAPYIDRNYTSTAGKLFFYNTKAKDKSACSASMVNSPSGLLAITAGHCVHSGGAGGEWNQNLEFAPSYDRGAARYGHFNVEALYTTNVWIEEGGATATSQALAHDVAFIKLAPNSSGKTGTQVVGGHGLAIGGASDWTARVFGYPNNIKYGGNWNGDSQYICTQPTFGEKRGIFPISDFVVIENCGHTTGSSGGPWLDTYVANKGLGIIRSVSSTKDEPTDLYSPVTGPYFGSFVKDLYQFAETGASPTS